MAAGRLTNGVTRNSAIRAADPENPTLEPNMECIGSHVADIWPFAYLRGIGMEPHFGGRVGHRRSAMAPFERDGGFLSIVTVALSVTIRPQFAIQTLKSTGRGVTLDPNFLLLPME